MSANWLYERQLQSIGAHTAAKNSVAMPRRSGSLEAACQWLI